MLAAFDPDFVISDVDLPPVLARLRLPALSFSKAAARTFPLALVSNLHDHFDEDGVLFIGDEQAPRHVTVNLGCLPQEDLTSMREHTEGTALVTVTDTLKVLESRPMRRWARIAGPLGLYGWTNTIGDPDSGAALLPQEGRTVIVSAPDDVEAICFFWNLRVFCPDLDVIWLPRQELADTKLDDIASSFWFDSAGDIPPTARGARRPDGYIYRRYNGQIWTTYSIEHPAVTTSQYFRIVQHRCALTCPRK
jgi:hypothetical protein